MNNCQNSSGLADMFRRILFLALFGVLSIAASAQGKTVSGTVIDQTGEPIVGASVLVKGTTIGVATDVDGNYSLTKVPDNAILEFRYIGYVSQDIKVDGRSEINVTMKEDVAMLDEVVVVGYGVQKKSDVTGAMTTLSAKDLQTRPVSNAFEALQGKAAGVDITTKERPGTIGSINIRGQRSLTASSSPLYVVDGVPLLSASAIETLNPRDIESIDILKDASATAIYGSRGANGVILVTTRNGKSGQFSLNYSGSVTTSKIVDRAKSMSAADFITFKRWAAYNLDPENYAHPNSPTKESDTRLFGSTLDGNTSFDNVMRGWASGTWNPAAVIDTDWTDFVTQTGFTQEHTLSASGGTEQMNAYASFGYLSNDGTQKGQWYKRYTGKVSANITPVKWFEIQASINATWSEQDYGMSTLGASSTTGRPDAIYDMSKSIFNHAVPYDADGNRVINPGGENTIFSIIDEQNHSTQKSQTFRALGSFAATLKLGEIWAPLKGLNYKIAFGPDFRHWREGAYIDGYSVNRVNNNGTEGTNFARLKNRRDFSWTLDNMITYNNTFNQKHNVAVTLLQTASKWNYEESAMSAYGLAKDSYKWNAFGTVDVTNSDSKAGMSSGIQDRQLESYMVRLNYGFDDRYLLTVSGRWDGASQLAKGHKWDFFPSAALAWRLNNEAFLRDFAWMNNLKLRLGVGTTGNAAVSPYSTLGAINSYWLPTPNGNEQIWVTNEPYYVKDLTGMANKDLGWEKTTQWNLGIDFGFLNNRLSGGIDLYWSKTNDLLMSTTIPSLTGYNTTLANVGKTSNHGVEVTINAIPVDTRDFTWNTNFNMAWQKDKIDELAYGKNDMKDNAWFIGEQLAVYYGYKNDGIWQNTPEDLAEMAKWNENGYTFTPGNVRPHDVDGDYKMTDEDRVVIGNQNPNWTLGWTNSFNYKGIELGFQIFGRFGYTFDTKGQPLTATANQYDFDYWTPDNPGATYQKPILAKATAGSGDPYASLLGFQKASFLKMRNISLGYNFPARLLQKATIKHLKIYAQAINPFSIYQSIDGFDLDTGKTYYNRSFSFGLEIGF